MWATGVRWRSAPWSQLQARKGAMVLADWWDRVTGRAGKREVFSGSERRRCMRRWRRTVACAHAECGGAAVGDLSGRALGEMPFAYLRSFDHLFEAALPEALDPLVVNQTCLVALGSGPILPAAVEHPGVALDVVEIDPAMVQIARERFLPDRLRCSWPPRAADDCASSWKTARFCGGRTAPPTMPSSTTSRRAAVLPLFVSDD